MKLTPVPPGRRFYELFRTQGKLVSETLTELSKSLLEGKSRHARLRDLEHECDEATHQIHNLVNSAFITPIDEGDILLLASSLDDVVDLAEETADKIDLYRIHSITGPARQMVEYLAQPGVELAAALDRFEGFGEVQPHRIEIHRLETAGEQLIRAALGDLVSRVTGAARS